MDDLNQLTKAELYERAIAAGLDLPRTMAKQDVIAALLGLTVTPVVAAKTITISEDNLERIRRATTASLEAKLPSLEEPFASAVRDELARREKAKPALIRAFKTEGSAMLWRDGFICQLEAGCIVTHEQAQALTAQGVALVETLVRVERDQMGAMRMVEVQP